MEYVDNIAGEDSYYSGYPRWEYVIAVDCEPSDDGFYKILSQLFIDIENVKSYMKKCNELGDTMKKMILCRVRYSREGKGDWFEYE